MIIRSRTKLCAILLSVLNISVVFGAIAPVVSNVVSALLMVTLPGGLLLTVFRLNVRSRAKFLYFATALGVLFLTVVGLAANTILPIFGIDDPLRALYILPILDALVLALMWGVRKTGFTEVAVRMPDLRTSAIGLIPGVWVACATIGALVLNNGGSNGLTIIVLVGVLINFIALFMLADRLSEDMIALHIFGCAVALLLMTSLRGWAVTGHDIQREFYVFQLARENWRWSIDMLRDPYNACMSITILPTVFAGFLRIADPYIYKVVFQVIFALCPVAVYMITRRISNKRLAILATLYFVAFPTFFTDMPMLNRQEIAFIFFSAMLLLLAERGQKYKTRSALFLLFGCGVVLAHYSTTYSMIGILGITAVLTTALKYPYVNRLLQRLFKIFKRSPPAFLRASKQAVITLPIVIILLVLAFTWNSILTRTSRGLSDTLSTAAQTALHGTSNDAKSIDTQSSIFGGKKADPAEKLANYVTYQETIRAEKDDVSKLYDKELTDNYKLAVADDEKIPLNAVGRVVDKSGVSVFALQASLRQLAAVVLQLLVVIGLLVLIFSRRHLFAQNAELIGLNITSMLFLSVLLVIPVLSLNYGLLRAFQQVLIVLALPATLGSLILVSWLPRRLMTTTVILVASLFYVSTTGLAAELTGGYVAQLHLHNSGQYYDSYYEHDGEVAAMHWLVDQSFGPVQSSIAGDRFASSKLQPLSRSKVDSDIYPALVQKDAFVLVGYTNINRGVAYALHNNEGLYYRYPLNFLSDNKDLIYSSSQSRIYR